jgi:hypothetical protein
VQKLLFELAKKILLEIGKTVFPFVSLSLLTADMNFKFKRLGFCNLLLIIIGVIWSSTFKLNASPSL